MFQLGLKILARFRIQNPSYTATKHIERTFLISDYY